MQPIDIQIIRGSLSEQDGEVRWVGHMGMYADALTKRMTADAVKEVLETGTIKMQLEKGQKMKKGDPAGKRQQALMAKLEYGLAVAGEDWHAQMAESAEDRVGLAYVV